MNRLFANRADTDLNPSEPSTSMEPRNSSNGAASTAAMPGLKTNFKNCVRVFERSLEELLLLHARMKGAVQRAFHAIVGQHQRIRPNRSYARRSLRPETKWHPSKDKKPSQKAIASPAPA